MMTTEQIIERLRELGCNKLIIHPPYADIGYYVCANGTGITAARYAATLHEALVKLLVRVEEQVKEGRG